MNAFNFYLARFFTSKVLLTSFLLLFLGGNVHAQGPCPMSKLVTNTNSGNTYCTIQAAVDDATAGDEIVVAPGTYVENVLINKNLTLKSTGGAAVTTIEGISGVGALGAIQVTSNTTGLTIGGAGEGFTILGIDNGLPGIENAAVYFQGNHSNAHVEGNTITAQGDAGLLTEYGATISGFVITGNTFDGQSFLGGNPAGNGFSMQFTLANVPRQLVTMGGGSGGGGTSNITFTNNQVTGTTGGLSSDAGNPEQGNTLVTLDANGALITGNTFAGATARYATSLRTRGPGTTISGNNFSSANLGDICGHIYMQNIGSTTDIVVAANTFDKGVYVSGETISTIGHVIGIYAATVTSGTVKVLPGTYDEGTIEINNGITLEGAQAGVTPVKGTRSGGESIINSSGTFAIVVKSNDVTIDGFEITGFGRDGINVRTFEDAFGAYGAYRNNITIQYNYIHVNGAGQRNGVVTGEFSGDPARSDKSALLNDFVISNNCLSINGVPGRALIFTSHFTDPGGFMEFTDFEMDYNVIEANSNGLFASADPTKFIFNNPKIRCNDISGMPTGINMGNLNNALVDGNVFSSISYAGAQIGVVGGFVTNNTFNNIGPSPYWPYSGVNYPSYALMLWGDQFGFPTGSGNCEVSNNFFNYNSYSPEEANAIRVYDGCDAATILINNNHFNDQGAEAGALTIQNQASGTLDATCNWWGTIDLGVIATRVEGPADFSTVLNSGTDAQPGTKGFQPAGSCDDPCPDALAEQNCNNPGCNRIRVIVCQNDPSPDLDAIITDDNSGYIAGATLNWYKNTGGAPGAPLASAPNVNTNNPKKRNFWVSQTLNGCESDAIQVRVIVNGMPQPVFSLPANGCQGGQVEVANHLSDAAGLANSYAVYDQNPALGNPSPIGVLSATNGAVDPGESLIINLVAGNQSYWVVATASNGCVNTAMATISGTPTATVNFIPNYTVAAGDAVNIPMSAMNATHLFWFDYSSFNNPDIGIIGNFGTPPLVFTAQNNTNAPVTAMIRAIPYYNNCAGIPRDFTITVNPVLNRQARPNSLQLAGTLLAGNAVMLNWDIAYDQELVRFEVEKEVAEGEFVSLGEVAYTGDGAYNYMDDEGIGSNNRYRLKLVHSDGRIVWSQVVEIYQDGIAENLIVYPNPTSGRVRVVLPSHLSFQSAAYPWQMSDVMGKVLMRGETTASEISIDMGHLPAGVYHLQMVFPEGKRSINRIVKH